MRLVEGCRSILQRGERRRDERGEKELNEKEKNKANMKGRSSEHDQEGG